MNLTPHVFKALTGKPLPPPVPGDRRRSPRMTVERRAELLRDGQPAVAVIVRDMSASGVGLLCPVPIKIGETFRLQFCTETGDAARLGCATIRCERTVELQDEYLVGAAFQAVIPVALFTIRRFVSAVARRLVA